MNVEKPSKKKFSPLSWVIVGLVIFVLVGARQLHPGGVRGLLGDFITWASSSSEVQALHDKMLAAPLYSLKL